MEIIPEASSLSGYSQAYPRFTPAVHNTLAVFFGNETHNAATTFARKTVPNGESVEQEWSSSINKIYNVDDARDKYDSQVNGVRLT